jgi:hypothetical protein
MVASRTTTKPCLEKFAFKLSASLFKVESKHETCLITSWPLTLKLKIIDRDKIRYRLFNWFKFRVIGKWWTILQKIPDERKSLEQLFFIKILFK